LFNDPGEYGGYMTPHEVIRWLVDTVSKNGTFLLNIPGKPDGTIDRKEKLILRKIGEWFKVNGEGIYATRPWTVFGEGPHMIKGGSFKGSKSARELGTRDVRYTRNKANTVVYAFVFGWPQQAPVLRSFATGAANHPGKVANVELLGSPEKIRWQQTAAGLRIELPRQKPALDYAVAFKISLA
jgi:alpha-L-fucosidase